ncbi:acyl-CoA dehydrogenase family protein [Spongiibacter nanhainus]|uniref:Acyl-CoA dehydrogenase family protein n=1 Tax=Spongiibacter nanhainus TaxID=2794344 RepID=A0A7T4R025_9GAMM|nr:acyl-CoA dehydrogenase family protein [Spongiibacter nanhainus]QQD17834.1 acyl-CoA dehydrogenase family protein [Spongiibacter nanhainus]
MQYQYNEEQQQFKDSLHKFVQDHYDYEARRSLAASEQGYSTEHWQQLAELGVLGLNFSEEHGGLGMDLGYAMAVSEEFGRGLVLEPYFATVVLAGRLLDRLGGDKAAELLPAVAAGETQLALAWEERISSGDPLRVSCTIEGGKVNGEKLAVLAAPSADALLVTARDGAGTLQVCLVGSNADGVSLEAYPMADGHRAATVTLTGADATVLASGAEPEAAVAVTLDEALLIMAAEAQGAMDKALEVSLDYCRTRKQFGMPLAAFQALQHRLADMMIHAEKSRSLMWAALQQVDTAEFADATAMLKAALGSNARYVGQQAIQLHGGIGMTDELNIGAYFKRLTTLELLLGNRNYHLGRLASEDAAKTASGGAAAA